MGVPGPVLPLFRQDQQGAGVTAPTRRDADRHGGSRGPEGWMPGKGARVASHIGAEARDKDVNSDRQHFPWSPENVLVDTVARLQRDLNHMRAESRYLRNLGVWDTLQKTRQVTYTSTKVPKFQGTTSWEQYQQVFDAIVLSNGWEVRPQHCSCSPIWRGMP